MAEVSRYRLHQDRKGMWWDLCLYVPTVLALASIGLKMWFSPEQTWAYVLFFMASFFLIAGANRILSSRLMVLPGSPRELELDRQHLSVVLRGGDKVDLVKNLRYFPDYAGRSFGLTGMDVSGKRRQFVFHRGQFADHSEFQQLRSALALYK